MKSNRYIVIMAGGVGSRFWPSSTSDRPKQFLDILGTGSSLIQQTFDRCKALLGAEQILILTNKKYKGQVMEHLPDLPEENILLEPSMNNTGPCVAYAALHIRARNPNASFAVLPSDHVILKPTAYLERLTEAFEFAEQNKAIITLGIQPTRPDTGYGYIETGKSDAEKVLPVNSFREKPDLETAKQYLEAEKYLWNAGMFVWHVDTIIEAFESFEPQILSCLHSDKFGTSEEQSFIDEAYPKTKNISIDYAVLERAKNVFTIPSDIGWSDLGTWNSLYSFAEKDEMENVVQCDKYFLEDVKRSIIRSQSGKIIVAKGLEDYIVIEEPEAILIFPRNLEQEIKPIVKRLNSQKE